jgi:hypothetical protein
MDKRLGAGHDLAVHSSFQDDPHSTFLHMALVDLTVPLTHEGIVATAEHLLRFGCDEVLIVDSGRSAHLYGFIALAQLDWLRLMISLLQLIARREVTVVEPALVADLLLETMTTRSLDPFQDPKPVLSELAVRHGCNSLLSVESVTRLSALYGRALGPAVGLSSRLLLLNPASPNEVIDSRWIAHRMLAGYGALRWTAHERRYLAEPRIVKVMGRA